MDPNPTAYPYSAICALEITAKNTLGKEVTKYGTGFLVGDQVLLTAGHCVYPHEDDLLTEYVQAIRVVPGASASVLQDLVNGGAKPGIVTSKALTVDGWSRLSLSGYDFGVVYLAESVSKKYGTIGIISVENGVSGSFEIAGFPAEETVAEMKSEIVTIDHTYANDSMSVLLYYKSNSTFGQSGAPLFFQSNGAYYAAGLHTTSDFTFNHGIGFTSAIHNQLTAMLAKA